MTSTILLPDLFLLSTRKDKQTKNKKQSKAVFLKSVFVIYVFYLFCIVYVFQNWIVIIISR